MTSATNTWHWVSLNVSSCIRDLIPDSSNSCMEGNQVGSQRKKSAQGIVAPPCPKQLSTQVQRGGSVSEPRLEPEPLFFFFFL